MAGSAGRSVAGVSVFRLSAALQRLPQCRYMERGYRHGIDRGLLRGRLKRYRGLISCVLFMGGEWQPEALQKMLAIVTQAGLKACLYTGLEREELEAVSDGILPYLTYLKTGRWQMELGGLDSATTNQKFVDLRTGEVLNRLFIKDKPKPKVFPVASI